MYIAMVKKDETELVEKEYDYDGNVVDNRRYFEWKFAKAANFWQDKPYEIRRYSQNGRRRKAA